MLHAALPGPDLYFPMLHLEQGPPSTPVCGFVCRECVLFENLFMRVFVWVLCMSGFDCVFCICRGC